MPDSMQPPNQPLPGLERWDPEELDRALEAGGRLVFYEYCISLVIITLRRPSRVQLLRKGQRGLLRGLPYTLLSLLLGWWGVPWGPIYTPLVVLTNLGGGCDVTEQYRSATWLPEKT
jgi:hypothetical protein